MNLKMVGAALLGWFVPGGAYLLSRRYVQFGLSLVLVCTALIGGTALHGGNLWPQPAELQGIDSFAGMVAQAGAAARMLAGLPYFAARAIEPQSFLAGQTHEYGTTLLALAGLFNLLAIADALQLRKERA